MHKALGQQGSQEQVGETVEMGADQGAWGSFLCVVLT